MIKRTVEISGKASSLSVRHNQLKIFQENSEVASIPCEDIGVLVVDHFGSSYTHPALLSIMDAGGVVLLCGANHLPKAMILPLSEHSEVVWRVEAQMTAKKTLKKRLWKQLIQEKIKGQGRNFPKDSSIRRKLFLLAARVRAGDPSNIEGQAARYYWPQLMNNIDFRRNPDGSGANLFLNYGYAILRAALARSIISAGLIPSLGLHHCNRSNYFCLADDLIEPLRPLVDHIVCNLIKHGESELNLDTKEKLLSILTLPVKTGNFDGPLLVHLPRMIASLVRCYQGEAQWMEIPKPCKSVDTEVCGSL
ncbi:MAG: type II CRISPR-associated endonuclease Cas1 [Planctomycetia bacterium]|nr:type II CRISPR-associated endonuclease Cas1 [Planctomycetia bacterium]